MNSWRPVTGIILLPVAVLILALSCPTTTAEPVYKCVVNGKTRYTSTPPAEGGQCQETIIRDDGPKPEELARMREEKQRKQEEERIANEAELKEREVRAKEIEAAAALRRARTQEEQLLMLQQQPQYDSSPVLAYPYWGGIIGRPLPALPPPRPPGRQPLPSGGFRPH